MPLLYSEAGLALRLALGPVGAGGGAVPPEDVAEATYVGDATDVTFGVNPAILEMNNQVAGDAQLRQATTSIQPTQVTKDTQTAFHCGDGGTLDMFQSAPEILSDFISNNEWHMFTVVNFDAVTASVAEDPAQRHMLFGVLTGHFALTLADDTGTPGAYGHANNGGDIAVNAAFTEGQWSLVEFWNDGSTMGIRVDDGTPDTSAWSGTIPTTAQGMNGPIIVGSSAFAGGWDSNTNTMAAISTYNGFLSTDNRNAVRAYYADIYGMSV